MGNLVFIFSCFCIVITMSTTSAVYQRHPELSVWQLLFLRGAISTLFMVLVLNKSIKKTLVDDIDSEEINGLVFRMV
jgi:hypothetical protein